MLPKALETAINELSKLPGVGPKTAERYALFILQQNNNTIGQLSAAIKQLQNGVAYCKKTFYLVEPGQELSQLYTDPARDKQVVAVVEDALDVIALEKTGKFKGVYHVLGGVLSPLDGIGPEQLHIKELLKRLKEDKVKELILATNATVEGESTALYIHKKLADLKIKVTRLARGLPIGSDLEYADQITLARALEGRQAI